MPRVIADYEPIAGATPPACRPLRLRWLLSCALVAVSVAIPEQVSAEVAPRIEVQVGFSGAFQVGRWTPITVRPEPRLAASSAAVIASDADGRPVEYPLEFIGDRFEGLFQSGRLDAAIRIAVQSGEGEAVRESLLPGDAAEVRAFRQSTRFWMLAGAHPGFELAADLANESRAGSPAGPAVQLLPVRPEEIPSRAEGLASLRVLVTSGEGLSTAQSEAIRRWVLTGGRLVVMAGEASSQNSLTEWLPVELGDRYSEQQTDALCGRIAAAVPNKGGPLLSLNRLELTRLRPRDARTLISGPTAPAVTRSAYGLGLVTVVALQLGQPPFYTPSVRDGEPQRVWGGLKYLCLQLATAENERSGEATASQSQLTPTGVSDLQSQLIAVLDEFPEVHRPSSWNVIGLMVLYLILVGPIDYLLVHRVLRRPQLTWVTLPMWALLATWWAGAFVAAGNEVPAAARQFSLCDIAADHGVQRITSFFSRYSAETRRCRLEAAPRFLEGTDERSERIQLAPLARPDEGFRGLYRRGGLQLGGAGYRLIPGEATAAAEQVPVDQWSSLVFAATAEAERTTDAGPLAQIRRVSNREGSIVRHELIHQLPGVIEDWFLVEDLQVTFPIGGERPLRPGETVDLTRGCGQRLLKAYIQGELISTQQRKVGVETFIRAGTYDPLGREAGKILRTLSFHEAVGGSDYTRLTNEPLLRLDCSEMVHLGRAVLFGRLSTPVVDFEVDGQPVVATEPETYIRLLIPTQPEVVDQPSESSRRD